jgi:hypothetical protein
MRNFRKWFPENHFPPNKLGQDVFVFNWRLKIEKKKNRDYRDRENIFFVFFILKKKHKFTIIK